MHLLSTRIVLGLCYLFLVIEAYTQIDSSGVYLTATDFSNKKLSYAKHCDYEKNNLYFNHFANAPNLTVYQGTEKIKIQKTEVYGARLCSGITYRFLNNVAYEVLNPEQNLLMYKLERVSAPKYPIPVKYFFSKGPRGALIPLTKRNIKHAFPDNRRLQIDLKKEVENGKSLLEYMIPMAGSLR
jgi:hypothetical protein